MQLDEGDTWEFGEIREGRAMRNVLALTALRS
jgi:hypothetical protein